MSPLTLISSIFGYLWKPIRFLYRLAILSFYMSISRRDVWNYAVTKGIESSQCPKEGLDADRIAFIVRYLGWGPVSKKLFDDLTVEKKCPKKSAKFRRNGNYYFSSVWYGDMDRAVKEFTMSVAYAPNGSEELGLAYADRSALLFRARLLPDCLLDIERALRNKYPDKLKAELYLLKATCLQMLNPDDTQEIRKVYGDVRKWARKMNKKNQKIIKEKIAEREMMKFEKEPTFTKCEAMKFLPKLPSQNRKIPGTSDALELQHSKEWGRHMVATRDIKPGEVLLVQKAYAKTLHINPRYKFCWNCGEQTWSSVPCENCVGVVFCSETCRSSGYLKHHNFECPIIEVMMELKFFDEMYMPLRLIREAQKELGGSIANLKRHVSRIDSERNPLRRGSGTNKTLDPKKFASVYCLRAHMEEELDTMGVFLGSSIMIAYFLATKSDFFGVRVDESLTTLSTCDDFIFVIQLLVQLMRINESNVYNTSMEKEGRRIIVPAGSFFNHSCNPSIHCTYHNDHLVCTAIKPIKKDEQIYCCYGPYFVTSSKEKRRENLMDSHHFDCKCEPCENNWPQELASEIMKPSRKNEYSDIAECLREINDMRYKYRVDENFFGLANSCMPDVAKDVAVISEIIDKFHNLGFEPNSFETVLAQSTLRDVLDVTGNKVLSLN